MKKIERLLLAVLVTALALSGCSAPKTEAPVEELPSAENVAQEDSTFRPTLMYMSDESGYIVPVMQQIPWEEGIGKATLNQIVCGKESTNARKSGLKGVIPEGTTVDLSIDKEGLATVKLSKEALNLKDALAEMNLVTGVVNTLLEFPTVKSVVIKIDGANNSVLPNGTSIKEPFIRQKLNMDNRAGVNVETANSLQVYFISEKGLLVPTTTLISEEPSLEVAINRLVEGPAASGTLMSALPEGTELLEVSLEAGVAVINFSSEIEGITEQADGGISAVKAIMLTAMQFSEVQEVYLRSEGTALEVETILPTYANMV